MSEELLASQEGVVHAVGFVEMSIRLFADVLVWIVPLYRVHDK